MRVFAISALVCWLALVAASAVARSAAPSGTPFKLVQATGCSAPKYLIGLACYDPEGHPEWKVGASEATYTGPGWDITYKYTIPAFIPATGAQAVLSATVTDRDPAGADGQVCIASGFTTGDTCARASAQKGETKTGTKTNTLTPYRAPDGSKATLRLSLGDSGDMYFTYEAEGPEAGRVTVLIGAHQLTDAFGRLTLAASGTFSSSSRLSDARRRPAI